MAASDGSRSVLEEIVVFNADRKPKRVRLKFKLMKANAFAFFRGTDHLFARDWPSLKPPDVGPSVLICGDLHLENFGAYRADDGAFFYDINDFDEALVAPCSFDLVRCTTSILLAAEHWALSPLQATGMALTFLEHYREALTTVPAAHSLDPDAPREGRGAIWELLGATALGTQTALLDHNTEIKSGRRRIIRSKDKHPEISPKRSEAIRRAVATYGHTTARPEAYKVLDVTGRILGIGSLGVRRYLVLIEGEGSPDRNRLLDIKEVLPSSVLSCTQVPQPDTGGSEAHRVVDAQRRLQARPTTGLDVIAIADEWFRMREMIPAENRSSLDRFQKKPAKLRSAIKVAGRLTGWSHLRGAGHGAGVGERAQSALVEWASSPALDAVLAAAVR